MIWFILAIIHAAARVRTQALAVRYQAYTARYDYRGRHWQDAAIMDLEWSKALAMMAARRTGRAYA